MSIQSIDIAAKMSQMVNLGCAPDSPAIRGVATISHEIDVISRSIREISSHLNGTLGGDMTRNVKLQKGDGTEKSIDQQNLVTSLESTLNVLRETYDLLSENRSILHN